MKHIYLLLTFSISLLLFSCDDYEQTKPSPTEIIFRKPGIAEFRLIQVSTGKQPEFKSDTLKLIIRNLSNNQIKDVKYSIRGFENGKKEYQYFNFWQEEIVGQTIELYKDTMIQLNPGFESIIGYENMEIDLISCKVEDEEKIHTYSGSYYGAYAVTRDSAFVSQGEHFSWIDYKGSITSYYDRQNFPWKSFKGQFINDSLLYGEIFLTDTIININANMVDSTGQFQLEYEFSIETGQTYKLSMNLIK
ncbi:MAG: hypothetical protein R2764_22210 [Bacteroidales bacterium]